MTRTNNRARIYDDTYVEMKKVMAKLRPKVLKMADFINIMFAQFKQGLKVKKVEITKRKSSKAL